MPPRLQKSKNKPNKKSAYRNDTRIFSHFLFAFFFAFENKKSLTYIVKTNKQAHAEEHCNIFLNVQSRSRQNTQGKRFCYSVSNQVAKGNIDYKAGQGFLRVSLAAEGEYAV